MEGETNEIQNLKKVEITLTQKKQSHHHQETSKRAIEIEPRNSFWSLIFAFTFAMSALGSSVYLILTDHPEAAALVGAGGLGAAIGSFVQIQKRNKDRDNIDESP